MNQLEKMYTANKYLIVKMIEQFDLTLEDIKDVPKWNRLLYTTIDDKKKFMLFAANHYKKVLKVSRIRGRIYADNFWNLTGLNILHTPKLIICIVGESGSGKTYLANYLHSVYWIKMIDSYTDRQPRYKGEIGHTFISTKEFNRITKGEMIAYTKFGKSQYCCKHDNVLAINSYVVDEIGVKYLKDNFSDRYDIISIRIHANPNLRKERVSQDRLERDKGMFVDSFDTYDHVIENDYTDSMEKEIDKIIEVEFEKRGLMY